MGGGGRPAPGRASREAGTGIVIKPDAGPPRVRCDPSLSYSHPDLLPFSLRSIDRSILFDDAIMMEYAGGTAAADHLCVLVHGVSLPVPYPQAVSPVASPRRVMSRVRLRPAIPSRAACGA